MSACPHVKKQALHRSKTQPTYVQVVVDKQQVASRRVIPLLLCGEDASTKVAEGEEEESATAVIPRTFKRSKVQP